MKTLTLTSNKNILKVLKEKDINISSYAQSIIDKVTITNKRNPAEGGDTDNSETADGV